MHAPRCKAHGQMTERQHVNADHAWMGTWFDCPTCRSSALIPSDELKAHLADQEHAAARSAFGGTVR